MALTDNDLKRFETVMVGVIHRTVPGMIKEATSGLATKDELTRATAGLATKEELMRATVSLATKDELKALALATKDDFNGLSAKIDRVESRLLTAIGLLQRDSFTRLDEHELRITRLETGR